MAQNLQVTVCYKDGTSSVLSVEYTQIVGSDLLLKLTNGEKHIITIDNTIDYIGIDPE